MCGIAGELAPGPYPKREAVAAMLGGMGHRGPDGGGISGKGDVTLGGVRLAISGPDDVPTPMGDAAQERVLVYNGELYGLSIGARESDTSWLFEKLLVHGPRCLSRSDGMYALAIADLPGSRLDLVRDPWGIKPLYVQRDETGLRFASEIEPLWRACPRFPVLGPDALLEYVGFGCRIDGATPIPGVSSLEPGTGLTAKLTSGVVDCRADRISDVPTLDPKGERASVSDVTSAIRESVRGCAETTRKLGVFLSGGVDSAAIAGFLAEAGVEGLHSFSLLLGADGVRDLRELNLPGTAWHTWTHHTHSPTPEEIDEAFEDALGITSEPCFPPSASHTLLLSRMAAGEGVRVILSGEGADELFGGYESYLPFAGLSASKRPARFYLDAAVFGWADLLAHGEVGEAHRALEGRLDALLDDSDDALLSLLGAERRISLRPLLDRLDHTSMRCSLEVRVPFLHGRVPETARAFVGRDGRRGTITKPELRAALQPVLGHAAWSTPKTPLRIPLSGWLRGERLGRLIGALESPRFDELIPLCRGAGLRQLTSKLRRNPGPSELQAALRLYQLFRYCHRFSS